MTVMMYVPVERGGLADYSAQLCNALAEQGCTTTLLSCAGFSPSVPLNNDVHFLPRLRPVGSLSGFRSLYLVRAVDRTLRYFVNCLIRQYWAHQLRPSILHLQLVTPIYDQFLLSLLPRETRVVMTVHDVLPHESSLKEAPRFLRRVYLRCDSLIVHSEANRRTLIDNFSANAAAIHVIPHGVADRDIAVFKNVARRDCGIPTDAFTILFFGSLRPDKGLSVLFDAMVMLVQQDPRIRLIVAGAPSRSVPASWMRHTVRDLGIESRVELRLDWISNELASQLFAVSDLVVLPYTHFDSQSGVLTQAYQFRIPLIVSDVGSLGETVRHDLSGLVVPPGDPGMLAQAVLAMMRSPRLCQVLATNMDNAMLEGKYSWSRVARLTLEAYRSCLDKSVQPDE